MILMLLPLYTAFLLAQTAPAAQDEGLVTAGRQLLAQLRFQPQQDATVFTGFGIDHAVAALSAVMARGQATTATADDWIDLHRSLDALVELHEIHGDFFRASLYANFQNVYYRNHEQDYEAALAASRNALELQQRSGQTSTLFLNWMNVAENLSSLGRIDEALGDYHQARKLLDDPTSPQAARLRRETIQAELAGKHRDAAQTDLEEFLQQSPSAPPLFHAEALMAQADVFNEDGKHTSVLDSVQEALRVMKGQAKADDFSYEAASQLMICVLASMRSLSYDEAMALAKRIDTEFPSLPFPVSPFAQAAMRLRRRLAGDIDGILREDVERLEKARAAGNVPSQIDALQSLAVSYRAANSVHQEILSLEEALTLEKSILSAQDLAQKSVNASFYLRILDSLGDAYADAREIGKARRCFDDMIHFIDAIPEMPLRNDLDEFYGWARLGKARVAELDDDPETARDILEQALKSDSKGPGKFNRADVLLQQARLEKSLAEQPAEAQRLYEKTIQAFRAQRYEAWEITARLEDARFLATPPGSLLPQAETKASENLQILQQEARTAQFVDAQWRISFIQGMMAESKQQIPEAIEAYEKAVGKLEAIRAGLSQQEQRQAFMDNATIQELYQRLIALLTRNGQREEAWDYLERGKARSFLEMLQGRQFHSASSTPEVAALQAIEKQIIDLRVQLTPQAEALVRGAGHNPAMLEEKLYQLESQFTLARQQASLGSTRAGQAYALLPSHLTKMQSLLPPRAALVEYSILTDSLTAFIADRNQVQQITWKADPKELRQNILQLRTLLGDPNSGAELKPLLESVSASVLSPVIEKLPKDVGHLVIVPGGYLNYLPFQVLEMGSGQPLIEHYSISYLPSASTFEFLPREWKFKNDLFLGALGNTEVDGMPPLPGTLKETAGIIKNYPKADTAFEKEFTHDRVEKALLQHAEVHLATHGLLDEQAPLFSAILTSPAPHQPSRLSLYELTQINLHAQLVVLSACETGLGKLQRGDEVTGLTRTFLLAGANTVVSSLWKVSDESTALLMQGFYSRLRSGQTPADAMRASALTVRKQYAHPFFWAPFIVTGAE
jgi:CHAT domain-containing protein/tetratricopeptide (TPR) repeat protein